MKILYAKSLLLCCSLLFTTGLHATRNYIQYYLWINEAEADFVDHKPRDCFRLYDKAFDHYERPFVKDCYIAAQLSWAAGDTARFLKYIRLCFENDMPLTALPAAPILRGLPEVAPEIYHSITRLYEQYGHSFKPDEQLREYIYQQTYIGDTLHEKIRTNPEAKILHAHFETAYRQYLYDHFLKEGRFPGEQLIGLESDERSRAFYAGHHYPDPIGQLPGAASGTADREEYTFSNHYALTPFIHYTCTYEHYQKELWQAVLNGYLHPKDYGMLQEMSYAWNHNGNLNLDSCSYPHQDCFYNILHNNPMRPQYDTYVTDPVLLQKVEEHRSSTFMQSFAVDEAKRKLEKEQGFRFFFGFMKMR